MALALPHFSEQGRWEREKVPDSERAKIIADMGTPQFALEIESVAGDCDAPVLGQAATEPAPEIAAETADDAAKRTALATFRKLPDYQREQRSLDEFFKSTLADKARPQTRWTELEPVNSSQRSFRLGGEHYVWISYTAGPGCGGWDGGLAMLFRVAGGPRPKAIPIPPPKGTSYQTGDVTAVVDTDHDGRVEMLLHPTFSAGTLLLDEELKPTEEVRFVSLDCPC